MQESLSIPEKKENIKSLVGKPLSNKIAEILDSLDFRFGGGGRQKEQQDMSNCP